MIIISLQNSAYAMTPMLSLHVRNYVTITFYNSDFSKKYVNEIIIVRASSSVKWITALKPIAPGRLAMDYICDVKTET